MPFPFELPEYERAQLAAREAGRGVQRKPTVQWKKPLRSRRLAAQLRTNHMVFPGYSVLAFRRWIDRDLLSPGGRWNGPRR